jgi:hypothetical protein
MQVCAIVQTCIYCWRSSHLAQKCVMVAQPDGEARKRLGTLRLIDEAFFAGNAA